MLWLLFEAGSFAFWLVIGAVLCLSTILIDTPRKRYEEENGGTIVSVAIVALLAGMALFSSFNPFVWAYHQLHENFALIPPIILGYLATGVIWSRYFKWNFLLGDTESHYKQERMEWLQEKGHIEATLETAVPAELQQEWHDYCQRNNLSSTVMPAGENKARIVKWIAYWPISVLNTLLRDWITRLCERVFELLKRLYLAPALKRAQTMQQDVAGAKNAKSMRNRAS